MSMAAGRPRPSGKRNRSDRERNKVRSNTIGWKCLGMAKRLSICLNKHHPHARQNRPWIVTILNVFTKHRLARTLSVHVRTALRLSELAPTASKNCWKNRWCERQNTRRAQTGFPKTPHNRMLYLRHPLYVAWCTKKFWRETSHPVAM